jgi:hypothetical protein
MNCRENKGFKCHKPDEVTFFNHSVSAAVSVVDGEVASGWLRTDLDEDDFSVIQVKGTGQRDTFHFFSSL